MAGILILAALLGLLLAGAMLRAARGQEIVAGSLEELERHIRPVDVAAFENLIDLEEEEFLRLHLPGALFRAMERRRLRAVGWYVQDIAHNAGLLLHLGEAVARQSNPEEAAAAREMADRALCVRAYAFLALAAIYVRIVFPGARISVGAVGEAYGSLTEDMSRLRRLHSAATRLGRGAIM
jgi:hypothetical protein